MLKKHEGEVEYEVCEEKDDQEVVRQGVLAYLSIGRLDIEKLLNALLIKDHLRHIFVLVLHRNIQRQPIGIIPNTAVTASH